VAVAESRWTNPSQPQTLQIAVFLLYANAFFTALEVLTVGLSAYFKHPPWGPLLIAAAALAVVAGRGVASERKWGYALAVAVAVFPFAFRVLAGLRLFGTNIVTLMFEIALVLLLLHDQSREYQRIWFK
jgi:hypothetical protein